MHDGNGSLTIEVYGLVTSLTKPSGMILKRISSIRNCAPSRLGAIIIATAGGVLVGGGASQAMAQNLAQPSQLLGDFELRNTSGVTSNAQLISEEARSQRPGDALPQTGRSQRTNLRVGPVEENTPDPVEDDPFAQTGVAVGTFRLTYGLEQLTGFTSNRQSAPIGEGGAVSVTRADFQLRSQWQRHELEITGEGEYEASFDEEVEPTPDINLNANLRLDLVDGFTATASGYYDYTTETASSTNLIGSAINEPGVASYGAALEIARSGGLIDINLRGSVDRQVYAHADLAGGGFVTQEDRNVTSYGITARVGYQASPALTPFLQAGYSQDVHDLRFDRNGEERDSSTYELRGGLAFDFNEKLNGEISIGYANQQFTDPALNALSGLVADAEINWSPYRETNIALGFSSEFNGSTNSGDSGSITYAGTLAATRRVRDNLELNAGIGLEYTNFEGLGREDTTFSAQAGYQYWLSRYLSFTGEANYQRLNVDGAIGSYDEAQFLMGIRVQR